MHSVLFFSFLFLRFCPECIRASAARRDRMTRQQKQMQSGDPEAATEEKQKAEKAAEEHAEQKKKSDNEMEEAKAKEPEKKSARKKVSLWILLSFFFGLTALLLGAR